MCGPEETPCFQACSCLQIHCFAGGWPASDQWVNQEHTLKRSTDQQAQIRKPTWTQRSLPDVTWTSRIWVGLLWRVRRSYCWIAVNLEVACLGIDDVWAMSVIAGAHTFPDSPCLPSLTEDKNIAVLSFICKHFPMWIERRWWECGKCDTLQIVKNLWNSSYQSVSSGGSCYFIQELVLILKTQKVENFSPL
jgi:hypothetical protein